MVGTQVDNEKVWINKAKQIQNGFVYIGIMENYCGINNESLERDSPMERFDI